MSEERDPIRLRDDPAEDAGLREMLDAARGEHADDAMLARVLGHVLASGGGGGGSGASGGTAAAAKIAAAVGAAVVGAGVIAMIATRTPESSHAPTAVADAAVVLDASVASDAFEPHDAGTDAFVLVARVAPRPPLPPTPPTTVASESDGALLMRAMREHDPSQRLELARSHRALYPNSAAAQEREAMIVIALAELDQSAEARAAADAFFARWPTSAHRSHIESVLARMH